MTLERAGHAKKEPETLFHILARYYVLAKKDYFDRHVIFGVETVKNWQVHMPSEDIAGHGGVN